MSNLSNKMLQIDFEEGFADIKKMRVTLEQAVKNEPKQPIFFEIWQKVDYIDQVMNNLSRNNQEVLAMKEDEIKQELSIQQLDLQIHFFEKALELKQHLGTFPQIASIIKSTTLDEKFLKVAIEVCKTSMTLLSLEKKATTLDKKGHLAAAQAIQTLTKQLDDELNKGHEMSEQIKQCKMNINLARPELEKHRDNNYLFANVALAILTAGIGYLVAALINKVSTGNFLFFAKTDSVTRLDLLEKQLDTVNQLTA